MSCEGMIRYAFVSCVQCVWAALSLLLSGSSMLHTVVMVISEKKVLYQFCFARKNNRNNCNFLLSIAFVSALRHCTLYQFCSGRRGSSQRLLKALSRAMPPGALSHSLSFPLSPIPLHMPCRAPSATSRQRQVRSVSQAHINFDIISRLTILVSLYAAG